MYVNKFTVRTIIQNVSYFKIGVKEKQYF